MWAEEGVEVVVRTFAQPCWGRMMSKKSVGARGDKGAQAASAGPKVGPTLGEGIVVIMTMMVMIMIMRRRRTKMKIMSFLLR